MVKVEGSENPLISVVVVDSRSKTNTNWVNKCLNSVRNQWWKEWELIIIDNTDHKYGVSQAYNIGIDNAKADWVLFLGDDDWITKDYLFSMYHLALEMDPEKVVAVTSFQTWFNEEKATLVQKSPQGMWRKSFLDENRFNEEMPKWVDMDLLDRAIRQGKEMRCLTWCYGYYYRSHDGQVSGKKRM